MPRRDDDEDPETDETHDVSSTASSPIKVNNVLNHLVFWAKIGIFCIAYFTEIFGSKITDQFYKTPTLLTPSIHGFYMIYVILGAEFVWVVMQGIPAWRGLPLVTVSSRWYILASSFQITWMILFSLGLVEISLGFGVASGVCMMALLLHADVQDPPSFCQLLFLRLPTSFPAGFWMFMSLVDLNIMMAAHYPPAKMIGIAVTSIGALVCLTTLFSVGIQRPDPIVSLVVGWGFFWISYYLDREATDLPFSPTVLESFRYVALGISFLNVCFVTLAAPLRLYRNCCLREKDE